MSNKICRNCGNNLKGSNVCPNCGTINFKENKGYSAFTTSKLSTKKILLAGGGVFIVILTISLYFIINGIKPKYNDHDTSVNSNQYKCIHATSCDGNNCIYIDKNGVKEQIVCESNNWYS